MHDDRESLNMMFFRKKNVSYMTVEEHMMDLRSCVIRSVVGCILASVIAYIFVDGLIAILLEPLKKLGHTSVVFFSPYEAFEMHIKCALYGGLVLSLPYTLWQLWGFLAPALLKEEKFAVRIAVLQSFFLFLFGGFFAYFLILPIVLNFLLSFESDAFKAILSCKKYMQFVLGLMVVFGLAFMSPVLLWFLNRLGVVRRDFLQKNRKYFFLILLIISAVLTPPDVFSQVLVTTFTYLLYEIAILFMR